MKACMMRVNYDPHYTHPNSNVNNNIHTKSTASMSNGSSVSVQKAYDNLHSRLKVARQVYGSVDRKSRDQMHQRAREQLQQTVNDLKSSSTADSSYNGTSHHAVQQKATEKTLNGTGAESTGQKTTAASMKRGAETTEVVDLLTGTRLLSPAVTNIGDNNPVLKPISSKEMPCYAQNGSTDTSKTVLSQKSVNTIGLKMHPKSDVKVQGRQSTDLLSSLTFQRSRTVVPSVDAGLTTRSQFIIDLERQARLEAEKAMRDKKIFTVMGPYPTLRASLRQRGWVEKMNSSSATVNNTRHLSADDSHTANGKSQEDGNMIAMMSHIVRNCTPTLLFSVKATDVGSKVTKSSQLVNHFGRASTFTTKAGLCQNLRSVPWFQNVDPNTFYPRCYNLGDNDEKDAFIDDYRLTACMGFIKHFLDKYGGYRGYYTAKPIRMPTRSAASDSTSASGGTLTRDLVSLTISRTSTTSAIVAASATRSDSCAGSPVASRRGSLTDNPPEGAAEAPSNTKTSTPNETSGDTPSNVSPKIVPQKNKRLSVKSLQLAMTRCEKFLTSCEHGDLDLPLESDMLTESQWDQYLVAYHQFISDQIEMDKKAIGLVSHCRQLLDRISVYWPQLDLDGYRDVWILKPGAKSRGRGIQCTNKLSEVMEAVSSSDCALVAQKYIERPLLIYKTKFDLRQWFLVTDWNPLTMWFYNACYLRFCSQEYTLDSFHVSIHLSNNSVQKYFTSAPTRSSKLPDDNMWKSEEFDQHLQSEGYGTVWADKIVPGMKQAILCALLCTQDQVEHRKSAFELYGADFMITEDMQPWLIEINSSPSMARTTRATAELVDQVLDDTVKVVLDRKTDKTCDTGLFELVYKQQQINEASMSEVSLAVEGKKIKRAAGPRMP